MHYAAICPTAELDRFAKSRTVQFCLAHEYLKGGAYAEWYREAARREGCQVILDNGAWEDEMVQFNELAGVIEELKPTVVVLPDVINSTRMTKYLHSAFRQYWAALENTNLGYTHHPQWMTVLQADAALEGDEEALFSYIKQYMTATTEWIGFPRAMGPLRVKVAQRLHDLGMWKQGTIHHALGMQGGAITELEFLAKLGFHSIDSSNPCWRAAGKQGNIDFSFNRFSGNDIYKISQRLREVDQACSSQ